MNNEPDAVVGVDGRIGPADVDVCAENIVELEILEQFSFGAFATHE